MHRRTAALMLATLPLAARSQGIDFSKVEIKTEKISDTLYMLTGAGGNLGLSVGEDAVFIVDDQFAPMAPKIKAAVARITPRPVQFVLNTHHHGDHTGGNEAFGKEGVLIFAHDNVRRRLSGQQLASFAGNRPPLAPKAALPVVTVAGEVTFHINGEEVHAFHVPRAHTDGDLIVHFRGSDALHMGDTFFSGGVYPYIDTASGGTADGLVAAHDRALALAGERTRIIPGHGALASRAQLQAWRDMVATVAARIRALRAEGRSDDEIRAARPAADFDATHGGGFIKPEAFVPMMLRALPR